MIKVFKKCEKSIDNKYGIKEITNLEELEKPFLMCLSSKEDDNSLFGLIKEGARACRVRTTDELAGGFKIEEMPVNFLCIKYENGKGSFNNIVDDVLYPLLTKDKNIDNMKKRARRMNFFAYCNGTIIYVQMEKQLKELLLSDGFNEKDIKDILSQISLVSLATQIDTSSIYASSVIFKDANDIDVYDHISKTGIKKMDYNNRMSIVANLNRDESSLAYIFYGSGNHSLKAYFQDTNIVKSSLCACVSRLVENSIENENSSELIPISSKFIKSIIIKNNGEFQDINESLINLDNSLNYPNVGRYSIEENDKLIEYEKSLNEESVYRL